MKKLIILIITNLLLLSILCKKTSLEVTEDLDLNLEFITTSSENWEPRGTIKFSQKGVKGGKLNFQVENIENTKTLISKLKQNCEEDGEYTLRFKLNDVFYYSSVNTVWL